MGRHRAGRKWRVRAAEHGASELARRAAERIADEHPAYARVAGQSAREAILRKREPARGRSAPGGEGESEDDIRRPGPRRPRSGPRRLVGRAEERPATGAARHAHNVARFGA